MSKISTKKIKILNVDAFIIKMKKITEYLHKKIMIVQIEQKKYLNKNKNFSSKYEKKNMIFLNVENIINICFNVKLDVRNINLYKTAKILFPLICKLKLSLSLKKFPLFYVNLFIMNDNNSSRRNVINLNFL